jgi:hypothetical protein
MKGGLVINPFYAEKKYTNDQAVRIFKLNSKFSILTNSSKTCITFKATLLDGVPSPFIHIRSGIIDTQVRTLLFKYFLINPFKDIPRLYFYTNTPRGGYRKFIELSQKTEIKHEYDIQLEVYKTTYNTISSAYEPVCPYPISCLTGLDKDDTLQEIIAKLDKQEDVIITTDTLGGILQTQDNSHFSIDDTDTYRHKIWNDLTGARARANITKLGCIVMEFMDGYVTLKEYLKTAPVPDRERAISLAAYELVRLKQIGFIHGDLIFENIMYNPDYKYITNDNTNKGRALLIDFGSALIDKEVLRLQEHDWLCENMENEDVMKDHRSNKIVYEYAGRIQRFYEPYTFKYIYEKRLNATLKFREKMLEHFEKFIKDYKRLSSPDKARLLNTSLITLETIKDFIYIFVYPTSAFISEEFPYCFRVTIIDSFNLKFQEIQKLQDKAMSVLGELKKITEIGKLLPQQPKQHQTHSKRKADDLRYDEGLVKLLEEQKDRRIEQKRIMSEKLQESSHTSEDEQGSGRFVNYNKKSKVYNARKRKTLKIKYRQTKKIKRKK